MTHFVRGDSSETRHQQCICQIWKKTLTQLYLVKTWHFTRPWNKGLKGELDEHFIDIFSYYSHMRRAINSRYLLLWAYTGAVLLYNILLYCAYITTVLFEVILQFTSYRCKDFCKLFYIFDFLCKGCNYSACKKIHLHEKPDMLHTWWLHLFLLLNFLEPRRKSNVKVFHQGVTKRCRLSGLTNSALVYEPKCGGRGGDCGISANEYRCTHRAQINLGNLTPYLAYELNISHTAISLWST